MRLRHWELKRYLKSLCPYLKVWLLEKQKAHHNKKMEKRKYDEESNKERKRKDNFKFLTKHVDKFDKLMKDASKEKESLPIDCSIHALSAMVVQSIATNMANYYGGMNRVKETFQDALDQEANLDTYRPRKIEKMFRESKNKMN